MSPKTQELEWRLSADYAVNGRLSPPLKGDLSHSSQCYHVMESLIQVKSLGKAIGQQCGGGGDLRVLRAQRQLPPALWRPDDSA